MKMLRDRVLVEETFERKSSSIITLDESKREDYYISTKKVLAIGKDVKEVKPGDEIVLVSYSQPENSTIVSGKEGDTKIVRTIIVPESDIIAIKTPEDANEV